MAAEPVRKRITLEELSGITGVSVKALRKTTLQLVDMLEGLN